MDFAVFITGCPFMWGYLYLRAFMGPKRIRKVGYVGRQV